jgi:hypothetical protein
VNAACPTNVGPLDAENVIQILTAPFPSIAVSIDTSTITTSADVAVLGRHVIPTATVVDLANIAMGITNVARVTSL